MSGGSGKLWRLITLRYRKDTKEIRFVSPDGSKLTILWSESGSKECAPPALLFHRVSIGLKGDGDAQAPMQLTKFCDSARSE